MSIPKFDISADFIAYINVTTNDLRQRLEQSHRTQACIFALCRKGVLKITINLNQYRIGPNDLIAIPAGSLVQITAMSDDVLLHIIMYSQQLIQSADMVKNMVEKLHLIENNNVIPLPKIPFQLYEEMFTLQAHLYKEVGNLLSHSTLQMLLGLTLQGVSELCPKQVEVKEFPGSKHFQQYRTFLQMVHADYTREHQVNYYAKEMKMQPAALCRLVKKESGQTAMEIINHTLIMDAKTQLRTSSTPVKDIAMSLGFNNAAFFNKFFKHHVGMTPQTFRKGYTL
ncbi:helix-turn-helix transcriptional regulator [Bacteroides sp. GD17]|jgi:AraC family transcriptional activator of pobA|uniref:AraC family transcriptional regulator n=1 Tax=Bacteroides sp. GD17 TaxID=3139826 RepID=UPI0025F3E0A0|nr:response regulator transcription factor [uncultured Bacteroides sp.]